MRLYHPKISVMLYKSVKRQEIVPGVPVATSRYAEQRAYDLTDWLGESSGVHLAKGVRDPAGAFSITLVDKPHKTLIETFYALIEPMDIVEIRMAHDPLEYAKPEQGYQLPVVMRGFVSQVTRTETMQGGKPNRAVVITGQDFGKILQIIQIFYLNGSAVGDNLLTELAYFHKYDLASGAKHKPAVEFLTDVLTRIINPYLKRIVMLANGQPSKPLAKGETVEKRRTVLRKKVSDQTIDRKAEKKKADALHLSALQHRVNMDSALASGDEVGYAAEKALMDDDLREWKETTNRIDGVSEEIVETEEEIEQLESETNPPATTAAFDVDMMGGEFSIKGTVSPWTVTKFNNDPLYRVLTSLLDVGPYNELFVEDREDSVVLVVRPAPFLDASFNAVQGVYPKTVTVISDDVVAISTSRRDAGVANYYWVDCSPWSLVSNEDAKMFAASGLPSSFIKFDYLNSDMKYYGVRKMEVNAALLPPGYAIADAPKKEKLQTETLNLQDWLDLRRKTLTEINKDNVVFESGTLRLRGNEKIKAGMQLEIQRGGSVYSSCYAVRVEHEFTPFGGFFTTVIFERGTGFIERSQQQEGVYRREIDGKGVI